MESQVWSTETIREAEQSDSSKPTHSKDVSGDSVMQLQKNSGVKTTMLYGVPIVALVINGTERLCLAQISNTLLKDYSYNEIHNRRVALGITCVQCTPVQLEVLRRAGAMPISSRRCGMVSKREAERLCKSFLSLAAPPHLPENFAFEVFHECAWGDRGNFIPSRYNSSRAKCIRCAYCNQLFSPNKFIFHSHRHANSKYVQPDAANFNSWRRHLQLAADNPSDDLVFAWEDVKAMFNGGSRKRSNNVAPGDRKRLKQDHTNAALHSQQTSSTQHNLHTLPEPPISSMIPFYNNNNHALPPWIPTPSSVKSSTAALLPFKEKPLPGFMGWPPSDFGFGFQMGFGPNFLLPAPNLNLPSPLFGEAPCRPSPTSNYVSNSTKLQSYPETDVMIPNYSGSSISTGQHHDKVMTSLTLANDPISSMTFGNEFALDLRQDRNKDYVSAFSPIIRSHMNGIPSHSIPLKVTDIDKSEDTEADIDVVGSFNAAFSEKADIEPEEKANSLDGLEQNHDNGPPNEPLHILRQKLQLERETRILFEHRLQQVRNAFEQFSNCNPKFTAPTTTATMASSTSNQ